VRRTLSVGKKNVRNHEKHHPKFTLGRAKVRRTSPSRDFRKRSIINFIQFLAETDAGRDIIEDDDARPAERGGGGIGVDAQIARIAAAIKSRARLPQ
jgi:hypothetical protein